jgi:hypothetical protein
MRAGKYRQSEAVQSRGCERILCPFYGPALLSHAEADMSTTIYDLPDFIEGERSVPKPAKPEQAPEEFSRGRLLGWLFRKLGVPRWGQLFSIFFP